jgi:plasmid maintenance system killer protein
MPPANLRNAAKKKLAMLHSAGRLEDLRIPPGNKLEALREDRAGQHKHSDQRSIPGVLRVAGWRCL